MNDHVTERTHASNSIALEMLQAPPKLLKLELVRLHQSLVEKKWQQRVDQFAIKFMVAITNTAAAVTKLLSKSDETWI